MAAVWMTIGGAALSVVASFAFLLAGLAHGESGYEHMAALMFNVAVALQTFALVLVWQAGAAQ